MQLFRPRCPVPPRGQAWIEKMLLWCVERLGDQPLRRPIVEPTDAFFPGAYLGTQQDMLRTVDQVRAHLGVSAGRFTLEVAVDDEMPGGRDSMPLNAVPIPVRRGIVAGHYEQRQGRGHLRIDPAQAADQLRLVAVAAHELCHELLLGQGGADGDDHEPLTDLLTVYTGFGIFTANAAFDFERYNAGGWRTRSLGYLNEAMYGYALACYAWMRSEPPEPAWWRYLDTNPRGYLKQGLKFLASFLGSTRLAGFAPVSTE